MEALEQYVGFLGFFIELEETEIASGTMEVNVRFRKVLLCGHQGSTQPEQGVGDADGFAESFEPAEGVSPGATGEFRLALGLEQFCAVGDDRSDAGAILSLLILGLCLKEGIGSGIELILLLLPKTYFVEEGTASDRVIQLLNPGPQSLEPCRGRMIGMEVFQLQEEDLITPPVERAAQPFVEFGGGEGIADGGVVLLKLPFGIGKVVEGDRFLCAVIQQASLVGSIAPFGRGGVPVPLLGQAAGLRHGAFGARDGNDGFGGRLGGTTAAK